MTAALAPEQLAVVERRDGALLVAANAGSGKTSVLVERYARSVLEDALRPDQLLAITFTDKAAGELRARVRARLVEGGARDAAGDLEGAWIMTFHAFCARVLRAHAVVAGLDPDFAVLDPAEARATRREAFDTALGAFLADREEGPRTATLDVAAAFGVDRLQETIERAHDVLRSRGQTRPALPARRAPDPAPARAELEAACAAAAAELAGARALPTIHAARDALAACAELLASEPEPSPAALDAVALKGKVSELSSAACERYRAARAAYAQALADRAAVPALALLDELLRGFAAAYEAAKRARSSLDFDDLELLARDLLRSRPAVAADYAARFERIMVDEFQDTNPLQLDLLETLDRANVCTVGDELQSIYRFRHADVGVFRARRDALAGAGAVATLQTSFRSRPEILDALEAAFAPWHAGWVPLVPGRPAADPAEARVELLVTDGPAFADDPPPGLGDGLPAGAPGRQAEARLVAQRVAALVADGTSPGDVAVLLRAATDMSLYERALELEGLATLASGGRGWWARQQVQDLCAYLGALANPRDEEALLALLASPLVGAASDALALLALGRDGRTLWEVVEDPGTRLPPGDRARIDALLSWFGREREEAPRLGLDALLTRVVERTGYDLHVLALPGGARRLANVHKLVRLAADVERRRGRDVRAFIDLAAAELEADVNEPDAPVDLAGLDAVRLMTIHAAKGLEFGVVVVADLGRRPNPTQPALLIGADGRVGLRLPSLEGGEARKTLDFAALQAEEKAAEDDEERRVMHVAMTRARERLVLSGAHNGGGGAPLSWIGPALVPDFDALAAGPPVADHVWRSGDRVARVRTVLSTPASVGAVLRVDPPPPRQLELALDGAAPAPVLPATESPPRVPATLSYSALSRYAACPYRFYLERELGLPAAEVPVHLREAAAPAPAIDPLLRGSLVHELLERGAPGAVPDADAVRALGAEHDVELGDAEVADLRAMVRAFAGSAVAARLARARDVRREHGFAFLLDGGPIVTGVLDVLATEDAGAALVLDYKSDPLEGAEPEAIVEATYGVQRRLYALAALRSGAPAVDVVHVFLEDPARPAVRSYAAADAPALAAELTAAAGPLIAGEYPVAGVPHRGLCATCPGRAGLCSYPPELTDREPGEALG